MLPSMQQLWQQPHTHSDEPAAPPAAQHATHLVASLASAAALSAAALAAWRSMMVTWRCSESSCACMCSEPGCAAYTATCLPSPTTDEC